MSASRRRGASVPITALAAGARGRVAGCNAGQDLLGRLSDLGFLPGTPIEVISVTDGPVIVQVFGRRIILGRGMAETLEVRPA